jgi:hypothetical protein
MLALAGLPGKTTEVVLLEITCLLRAVNTLLAWRSSLLQDGAWYACPWNTLPLTVFYQIDGIEYQRRRMPAWAISKTPLASGRKILSVCSLVICEKEGREKREAISS